MRRAGIVVLMAVAIVVPGACAVPVGERRLMLGAVGQSRAEIERRESETGVPLAGVRVFKRWDWTLFDADETWARDTGHTVFVSVKSRRGDGSPIRWRDIADSRPGDPLHQDMVRQAAQIKDFGAIVYFTFSHEPEAKGSRPMGEGADFVDAWRKVVDLQRAQGVTNARYVWTVTSVAFERTDRTAASLFYPGDAYVDHIAADSYNGYACDNPKGRWAEPAEVVEGQRRFGELHPDKGLMLLEWGSVEDPERPGRRAEWLNAARKMFLSPGYEQYRALLSWDARNLGGAAPACDFDVARTPDSLAAWRAIATDPGYSAKSPCDLGDCRLPEDSGAIVANLWWRVTGLFRRAPALRRKERSGP
ncbi:glycosyl hydrolase [Nonomuraea cavernae]|uniref:glycosyl hydrolase n=1 Tax=Nonomuraea cavernae TaxID=2045107 RepID=UPI0033DDB05A